MKMNGIAFILVSLLAQVGSSASANYPSRFEEANR
jgi:hypothetical protein